MSVIKLKRIKGNNLFFVAVKVIGQDVNNYCDGFMIVDTGASTTSINKLVLDRINPFKTDKYQLTRTGNGVIQMPLYNVNLEVKGLLSLPFLRVGMIECREDCVGVLGMDILEKCDMLMKHEDGELAMELRSPSDEIEFSLFRIGQPIEKVTSKKITV